MSQPGVGDMVMFNFQVGTGASCQRPAIVLSQKDEKTLNLSVFIDKRNDGVLALNADELWSGILSRFDVVKGNGNGQWSEKPGK